VHFTAPLGFSTLREGRTDGGSYEVLGNDAAEFVRTHPEQDDVAHAQPIDASTRQTTEQGREANTEAHHGCQVSRQRSVLMGCVVLENSSSPAIILVAVRHA
jgi:hypothetical protein